MNDALVFVCLAEAVAFATAFFFAQRDRQRERAAADAREQKLLDRVMARDLAEFKAYEPRPASPPIPQVVDDEDEARYAARVRMYPGPGEEAA